jgi:hypothetical protein
MPAFIVFQQTADGSWHQIPEPIDAATADRAIEAVRTTAGTFVAVLVRSFRPRTHYAPPKPPREAKPKGDDF